MIIKSEFKVDLFQMKHTSDSSALLAAITEANSAMFGRRITLQFPYIKDEEQSFSGELPEMSANKDHQYFDLYTRELIIFSKQEWTDIHNELESMKQSNAGFTPIINKITNLLNSKK